MHKPNLHPISASGIPVSPKPSLRVLVIDDDEAVLASLKDSLIFLGHQVQAASGGKRGVEIFCTAVLKSEPYDVVITDLNMPDLDGYEVVKQIKAESPATPVIILSGLGALEHRAKRIPAQVDALVNKPPQLKELNALLLQLAKGPLGLCL